MKLRITYSTRKVLTLMHRLLPKIIKRGIKIGLRPIRKVLIESLKLTYKSDYNSVIYLNNHEEIKPAGLEPVIDTIHNTEQPSTPPKKYDVLIFANVGWSARKHRPHHIATACAARGHRVFYISAGSDHPPKEYAIAKGIIEVGLWTSTLFNRYETIAEGVVAEDMMQGISELRKRHHIDDAVMHIHLQSWTKLAWQLRKKYEWRIIYDCMDEWEGFPGMGKALVSIEKELVQGADLVITTAELLRKKWAPFNKNTVLIRNAVFAESYMAQCIPSGLLSGVNRPIIGFIGALASWVNFELIAAVAKSNPNWTFVLVGDIHVAPHELRGLDRMENVIMPGLQPYESMPLYLFWFDVAIIAFVLDKITAAVDPVKFYEYAASGTPIVSTTLPELDMYKGIYYEANTAKAFELSIKQALLENPEQRARLQAVARQNTWNHRYELLHEETMSLWPMMSIIIVTCGQMELTCRCLDTVLKNTSHPALEVIIIDNGSTDGTVKYLRWLADQDKRVQLILNIDNKGFAAANNQGLAIAQGEILILLNNDTEVSPGWHIPLIRHLNDPTIGLVGPRSDNVGNSAKINLPSIYKDDYAAFTRRLQLDYTGQVFDIKMLGMYCVAMLRSVYEKIGLLDEGYGVGMFEDDDYAERVRASGLRVVCARDAFVHHVGQGTFRVLIANGEYNKIWDTNRARFEARWGPWNAQ